MFLSLGLHKNSLVHTHNEHRILHPKIQTNQKKPA